MRKDGPEKWGLFYISKFLNSITELHFGLWLNLWFQTIDELFEGDYAENAKRRARKMGTFLYLKIFEARGK